MVFNLSICENEKADLQYLSSLVQQWSDKTGRKTAIAAYESAEAFLFRYAENKQVDILLLDIEMGRMNGVELAQRIRQDNEAVQIVFITGFPDFMAEGYEVSALHYLMKPVKEEKLFAVLERACQNVQRTERALLLTIKGEHIRLPVSTIMCVEAFAHHVTLTTTTKEYDIPLSISELYNRLGDGFVRCHRSYIVGLQHIKRITRTDVILDNQRTVPLARRSYDEVNQAFIAFFKGD